MRICCKSRKVFRTNSRVCTATVGKIADLVLLDNNPLDNIANIRKINAVPKITQPVIVRVISEYFPDILLKTGP